MAKLERRQRRAKARKRENRKRAGVSKGDPDRFTVAYDSPESLVSAGPLVVASWAVPLSLERALQAEGRSVPAPVVGHVLVDTGATRTAIAKEVAERDLGLKATSVVETYGAGGLHKNPSYLARFLLTIEGENGDQIQVVREFEVMGIPDLDRNLALVVNRAPQEPVRLIGLLGRDFLRHTTLTYDGNSGRVDVQLHLDSMPEGRVIKSPTSRR